MDISLQADFILGESSVRGVCCIEQSYDLSYENVLEGISRAVKYTVDAVLPVIAEIHGFWVEFYYPRENRKSAYGHFSDDQGYEISPDRKEKVAIVGAVVSRFLSGDNLENYFGPPPTIYMSGDEEIPENTKVRILFGRDKYIEYQVDHPDAIYGINEALVTKLTLLPVSAQH